VGRARFIGAVADVVDACLSDDQRRIDAAQVRAMPHVADAARYMPVTEWMPLAQKVAFAPGTVLSAPVLVARDSVKYFHKLFPTLQADSQKKDVPPGFVLMTDTRAEQPAADNPVTSLVNFKDTAETRRKWADPPLLPDCIVVSQRPEVLEPAAEYGAHFILHREYEATRTQIANVVNWHAACGFGFAGMDIGSYGAASDLPGSMPRMPGALHNPAAGVTNLVGEATSMGYIAAPAWPVAGPPPWQT
jgi:hypothetical protein